MGFAFKLEVGRHLALEVPNNCLIFKSLEMLEEKTTFDILIARGAALEVRDFKKTSISERVDRSRRSSCWNVGNVGLFLAGICFKCEGKWNFLSYLRVFSSWIWEVLGEAAQGLGWRHNPWNSGQNGWMRTRFGGDHRGWWLDLVISEEFSDPNNSMIQNARFKGFGFWGGSELECHP